MKKISIFGIAAALMMGTAALSSCSNDELTVGNEAQIAKNGAKTYSFSVQAVMNNEASTRVFTLGENTISSAFSTDEPVYMFIKRGNVIAYGNKAINPTNVSDDGQSCTIDVTKTDDFYFIPTSFTPAEGDEIYLYYGMTSDTSNHINGYFDFATDGKKATAEGMDYNLAKTTIESVDNDALTFNDKFSFTNINSIFRQKLTFKNGSSTVTPTITKVVISSANNKTVKHYYPFGNEAYEYGPIVTEPDLSTGDGSIYFSLIFNNDNKNDAITFTAYDEEGKTYTCTKDAPTAGFENNMYYYGDAELELLSGVITPTISGLNSYEHKPADSGDGSYSFYITDDPADFSISGNSEQNTFFLAAGGTVTLDNINATIREDVSPENFFMNIGNVENGFTLNLNGDNIITVLNGTTPFYGNGADLKLRCEGESATLIIRTKVAVKALCGIAGFSNSPFGIGNSGIETDEEINEGSGDSYTMLQPLAADGYKVKRSSMETVYVNIGGSDEELNEWTFTVEKINP